MTGIRRPPGPSSSARSSRWSWPCRTRSAPGAREHGRQRGAISQVAALAALVHHRRVVNQHHAHPARDLGAGQQRLEARELRRADLAPGAEVARGDAAVDADERERPAQPHERIALARLGDRRRARGAVADAVDVAGLELPNSRSNAPARTTSAT